MLGMMHRFTLLTLLLFTFALPAWCETLGPDVDIENVPTPLTLPELLPPGGIDAVDVDFWMRIEASYDGRPMDSRFIHWQIKPVDGQLVFTLESGTAGNSKLHSCAQITYAKTGELTAYRNVSYLHGKKASEVVGTVVDDQLVLKDTTFEGNGQSVTTETKSLKPFETTVPSEWFSLIAAYHIRKGSLGYQFERTDTAYRFQHADTIIEDVGTEQVEWNGKTYTARMLLGKRTFDKRKADKPDSKLQYLVLPNGELMYMRNLYFGYKFLGNRVTKEAIQKEFWLPPTQEK